MELDFFFFFKGKMTMRKYIIDYAKKKYIKIN